MMQTQTIYINFTGGIVSPGYLKEILEIAALAKVENVRFGLRQQLIIDIPARQFAIFETECRQKSITFYKKKEAKPNICSSYPAAAIFTVDNWLREGVYKDVFDLFDYKPHFKINICDSTQSLVSFFTGHINWISSSAPHFWHLYLRFPKTQNLYCFPELIYTNDIAAVSKQIERLLIENSTIINGDSLQQRLRACITYISKPVVSKLSPPQFSLPYYEGFNKFDNTYWLGIYRRNEQFPVSFLLDVCAICIETKIGQLYTTPWKSLIIKGIETTHRQLWDYVLGKYRINVRHAANELAWQVEDNNEYGLLLKRHIIRYFDKEDVRTYGLCFAVQMQPHSGMFGSVIIKKQDGKNPDKLKALDRFEILYCRNFNPNSFETISFRKNVEKEYLGPYLVALCKFFYEQQSSQQIRPLQAQQHTPVTEEMIASEKMVHQCRHCLSIYDVSTGDPDNNIAAGTSFYNLPDTYHCPLCEAGKQAFITVKESSLQLQNF